MHASLFERNLAGCTTENFVRLLTRVQDRTGVLHDGTEADDLMAILWQAWGILDESQKSAFLSSPACARFSDTDFCQGFTK